MGELRLSRGGGGGGSRNVLTWNELGWLDNLTKCEKIGLLGETHLQVELSDNNSFFLILFVILDRVRIRRRLHCRRGVSEYNV